MAKNTLERKNLIHSATGLAGPIPHRAYCKPQCYAKGKRERSIFCKCKGCRRDAHGLGWNYAFEHGYLKDLPIGFQKQPLDHEWLFPPTPIEDADQH
jgi:hypothetical protein